MEKVSKDNGLKYKNLTLKACEDLPSFKKVASAVKEVRTAGYLCFEKPELIELSGYPLSSEYQYLNIQVDLCSGASCQSESAMRTFFQNIQLQVVYMNANMNYKDFTDPMQFFIDQPLIIPLEPTR